MISPRKFANRSVRKIMDAAEAEFAEKGFDAARIDDVARRAGVNKSHIYYHFDGKEQLLDELIELRLSEMLAEKDALLSDVAVLDDAVAERFLRDSITDLLARRRDFLRIVLMESLKQTGDRPPMIRLVRAVADDALARFHALGLDPDPAEFATAVHYFALVPVVSQLLLGRAWAEELQLDPSAEQENFLGLLSDIYLGYLGRIRHGRGNPSKNPEQ